jgi:hypothetical protein
MSRTYVWGAAVVLACMLAPARSASADQVFNFHVGYFALRGEDARIADDVILQNLDLHAFQISDFNHANVGGEWLVGFGEFIEAGVGIGFYQRTVPSVYRGFVHPDGREIEQDFRLRLLPISASVRLLPIGRNAGIQPYVGGGLGIINWRYTEVGEFVDFRDFGIFRDRFVAQGTDAGPLFVAGVRVPFGLTFMTGAEIRYHRARGTLDPVDFLDDSIDLGGLTTQITIGFRF